jgi:hypothetical protein
VVLRAVFLEGMPFHLLIHRFWPMALIGVAAFSIAGSGCSAIACTETWGPYILAIIIKALLRKKAHFIQGDNIQH